MTVRKESDHFTQVRVDGIHMVGYQETGEAYIKLRAQDKSSGGVSGAFPKGRDTIYTENQLAERIRLYEEKGLDMDVSNRAMEMIQHHKAHHPFVSKMDQAHERATEYRQHVIQHGGPR